MLHVNDFPKGNVKSSVKTPVTSGQTPVFGEIIILPTNGSRAPFTSMPKSEGSRIIMYIDLTVHSPLKILITSVVLSIYLFKK